MPHKINPKDFENVKSLWKAYVPRLLTVMLDQISEHQRDLTNSASSRFVTEFVTAFAYGVYRTSGALESIEPDVGRMKEILEEGKDPVTAEPLYVLLSMAGHADAHEEARVLSRQARAADVSLAQLIRSQPELQKHFAALSAEQRSVIDNPAHYLGAAAAAARRICATWANRLGAE
jgi:adenylosuccinate lyase